MRITLDIYRNFSQAEANGKTQNELEKYTVGLFFKKKSRSIERPI